MRSSQIEIGDGERINNMLIFLHLIPTIPEKYPDLQNPKTVSVEFNLPRVVVEIVKSTTYDKKKLHFMLKQYFFYKMTKN